MTQTDPTGRSSHPTTGPGASPIENRPVEPSEALCEHDPTQTLAAVITPIGASGIAVIRVTGPRAFAVVEKVFRPIGKPAQLTEAAEGRVLYGQIVDDRQVIDDVVLTLRKAKDPTSATPVCLADINAHGGVRVVQRILMLLARCGALLTDPQRIGMVGWQPRSVIEREVWSSIVRVPTHRAATWLLNQPSVLSAFIRRQTERLPAEPNAVLEELRTLIDRYASAKFLIEGAGIVIAGPPNAGKSSLANRLFGQRQSIVSEQPGTTRDWVAEPAAVEGIPIVLTDTAGLRHTNDPIEQASIERGLERARRSDVVLLVIDASAPTEVSLDAVQVARTHLRPARTILVLNKIDRPGGPSLDAPWEGQWIGRVAVSAATGEGLDRLGRCIAEALGLSDWSDHTSAPWTTRQMELLNRAVSALPHDSLGAVAVLADLLGENADREPAHER